jgi:hypothetical protein
MRAAWSIGVVERVVRLKLARPIAQLIQSIARFLIIEGAMRASKTWGCLIKWRMRVDQYPGIPLVMARWKDDDLHNKLIPDYRRVCDLLQLPYGDWNAREECFVFPNGSRIYALSLKTSEKNSAQSKPRGFTVAGVYISQLEEVPHDVAREWMMRLSAPGFPHQFLADANPVHQGHWIAEEWPEDNSKPDYEYLTASIWDNAHNLDASTIQAAEAMYPPGHPMRPAKLEGKRGANSEGAPVYGEYFRPSAHVYPDLEPWPYAPILVGWDFGSKHPAVSIAQVLPWGSFWSLGAIMGDNVMLEWFGPRVLELLGEWFPGQAFLHCGDPAGAHRTSQGVTLNANRVLQGLGLNLKFLDDSNDLRVRYGCIQTLGGYMLRDTHRFASHDDETVRQAEDWILSTGPRGDSFISRPQFQDDAEPAFLLNPRGLLISRRKETPVSLIEQALGGGYVWDDQFHGVGNLANIRRPSKDGFYEHPMNATEYIVHHFAQTRPSEAVVLQAWQREQRAQLRRSTEGLFPPALPKDKDRYDEKRRRAGAARAGGRGGW